MSSINKFCVMGRLVRDPEIKETENGNKVANITLAVDREYKDKEGKKITDFLNYSLWNKDAENIKNYSKKGSHVVLEGTFNDKVIELEDGKKIHTFNPVVTKYQSIENINKIDNEISDEKEIEMEK
jgi:single-strand DNA-binding protein